MEEEKKRRFQVRKSETNLLPVNPNTSTINVPLKRINRSVTFDAWPEHVSRDLTSNLYIPFPRYPPLFHRLHSHSVLAEAPSRFSPTSRCTAGYFLSALVASVSRTRRTRRRTRVRRRNRTAVCETTAASSATSQRTLRTLRATTPPWRARTGCRPPAPSPRGRGAGVETGRCLAAPPPAAAPAATSHKVPPAPRCPT